MPFRIIRDDITQMNCDAIVNTANGSVEPNSRCEDAIYGAAGYELMLEARKKTGRLSPGEAVITPGFALPAKYVIHAASPRYIDGESGEAELLHRCYAESLKLAKRYGLNSVAFPLISSGNFGYPKEEAVLIAVEEIKHFLERNEMDIFIVMFDELSTVVVRKKYPKLNRLLDNYYIHASQKETGPDAKIRPSADAQKSRIRDGSILLPLKPPSLSGSRRNADGAPQKAEKPQISQQRYKEADAKASKKVLSEEEIPKFLRPVKKASEICADLEIEECEACEIEPIGFIEQNQDKLAERIAHRADGFQPYFFYLLKSKKLENADVRKRACIDKRLFSKIKNNENYHPDKLTALRLCVGAMLNLDETRDLLARAGYAMSPGNIADIIFQFFIEGGIYDIIEIDIMFEEYGLPPIIA